MAGKPRTTAKKKKKQTIEEAIVNIHSTYNNTIITVAKENGDVFLRRSAGTVGYKGTRKKTPYAAQKAAEECVNELKGYNTKRVQIQWNRTGSGKDSATKVFSTSDLEVVSFKDTTRRSHSRSFKKTKR